jgi:type VI secretion system protein ImpC
VEGLPAHTFPTDDGGVDMKCPTEIAISDRREAELAKNGFMPLVHRKNSDFAAFIGAQSLQKPFEYDDPDATANANLSARLPYLFACCRFAHYLKCIVRDKIGSFKEEELTVWLQTWINQSSTPIRRCRRRRPRPGAARQLVEVIENERIQATMLRSSSFAHYQLEGMDIRLTVSRLSGVLAATRISFLGLRGSQYGL